MIQEFNFRVYIQRKQKHYLRESSSLPRSLQYYLQYPRQKCSLTDEWIKKMWLHTHTHIHTEVHIYSSALKKEILPIVPTWMELEGITLSEISQRQRQILYDLTYMWNLEKPNS